MITMQDPRELRAHRARTTAVVSLYLNVLDELAGQALDGGGEVTAVRDAPFATAARLRFQLTAPGP